MSDDNGDSSSSGDGSNQRANRKAQVADTPDSDPRGGSSGSEGGGDGGSSSEGGGDD